MNVARAFHMFGTDRSGDIDASELQMTLVQLGMEVDSAQVNPGPLPEWRSARNDLIALRAKSS